MTVTILEMLGQWSSLVADFSETYSIRLVREYPLMSWHEFVMHASGLLAVDSRLSRRFTPEPTEA